jgi:hypothetical protein
VIRCAAVLLSLGCLVGCASQPITSSPLPKTLPESNEIPGKSALRSATALRHDALKNLHAFEASKYHCATVTVIDTDSTDLKGDVLVDERGRLHSGVITDRWVVDACGTRQVLVLVFQPDGKGGNYVAIAENSK